MSRRVIVGSIAFSENIDKITFLTNGIIGVDEHGIIAFVDDLGDSTSLAKTYVRSHGWDTDIEIIHLDKGSFLCPGFIDTHTVCFFYLY